MKTIVKYAIVGTSGAAVGYLGGWMIATIKAKKIIGQLEKEFDQVVEDITKDISSQVDDAAARITKTGKYASIDEAAAVLIPEEHEESEIVLGDDDIWDAEEVTPDVLEKYKDRIHEDGYISFPGPDDEEATEAQEDEEESDDEPISSTPEFRTVRDPHGPYVISIDEYMEDDPDSPFSKSELTYFEGDNVLIDEREQIADIEKTIGSNNLDRWGEGTTDADQVYIRNERLEVDFEVTRDENTYSRAVLGIIPEDEIRRSMVKPLRMRDGDDD